LLLILCFPRCKFPNANGGIAGNHFFSSSELYSKPMGLREKRALNTLKTEIVPKYQVLLDNAVGFHIELGIDWDSLPEREEPLDGLLRDDCASSFALVVEVMKAITIDDIGKNALHEKINSIVLINYNISGSDTGKRRVIIQDGRLEIHCGWGSYTSEIYDNYNNEFQHLIENLL
jgi:hypothetical protein